MQAPLSPASPGRKTGGIGGLITAMKEVEDKIAYMEAAHSTVDNQVQDMGNDVERLKEQQMYSGNQVE